MMRDDTDRNDDYDDGNNNNNNNKLHFRCTSVYVLYRPFNPRALGQLDYFL
jgi:hypothetical protein